MDGIGLYLVTSEIDTKGGMEFDWWLSNVVETHHFGIHQLSFLYDVTQGGVIRPVFYVDMAVGMPIAFHVADCLSLVANVLAPVFGHPNALPAYSSSLKYTLRVVRDNDTDEVAKYCATLGSIVSMDYDTSNVLQPPEVRIVTTSGASFTWVVPDSGAGVYSFLEQLMANVSDMVPDELPNMRRRLRAVEQ